MKAFEVDEGMPRYSLTGTTTAGQAGEAVLVPVDAYRGAVRAAIKAGDSFTLQYTVSPRSAVEAGTATWFDGPAGTQTTTPATDRVDGPVTAVRVGAAGATANAEWELLV